MKSQPYRAISTKILYAVIFKNQNLKNALSLTAKGLEQESTIKSLCYETLRHYHNLEKLWLLETNKKPKDKIVQVLITQALCEKIILNKPEYAIVDETIKSLKKLNKKWASGLVNAILRKSFEKNHKQEDFEPQYSHPQWWVDKISTDWPEQTEFILKSNNIKPPLWVRYTNPNNKPIEDGWLAHESINGAFLIPDSETKNIPLFAQGKVSVQDASAQLAAQILNPKAGDKILDACAAPGGKTGHLLELCPQIHLDAVEMHENRAKKIHQNLKRLNLKANVIVADANQLDDDLAYDKILLDVPCSSSGIIRRQPDIKFHRTNQELESICRDQEGLLSAMSQLVKTNGLLLYATCSIFSEENQNQIDSFLKKNSNFIELPLEYPFATSCHRGIQILPGVENMDGFYYCLLKKTNDKPN